VISLPLSPDEISNTETSSTETDDEEKEESKDESTEDEQQSEPAPAETRGPPRGGRRPGQGGADEGYVRFRLPRIKENEMFGIADQLLGASRIKVMCADGKSRMGRIPGKLKKRMWIRVGDLVIIRPWKFQDEKSDIVWRYTKTQASLLSRRNMLPDTINIF
jgi:translation initiation factor 1A